MSAPVLPSPPPASSRRPRGRVLEILAFVLVYVAGTSVAAVALFGGGSEGAAATPVETTAPPVSVSPSPLPSSEPTLTSPPVVSPSEVVPAGGPVMTTTATSNVSNAGCTANLFFTWDVDLGTAPDDRTAIVEVQGPTGSKRFTTHVKGNTVTLRTQMPIPAPHAEWTGSLLTIGDVPVFDTPLMVSVDVPTC